MNALALSATLKHDHQQAIATLVEQFKTGKPSTRTINQFLKQIALSTDATLLRLWKATQIPEQAALLAVGGYGRAELFPYSDVDVLILLPDTCVLDENHHMRTSIENFVGRCWDLGLRIGSSVRTVTECLQEAAQDITIQTALLESRLLTGNTQLYKTFEQAYFKQLNVGAFIQDKIGEMRRRHQKYNNTPYALEPNCKESPGGLRDLHVILWITKAAQLGNDWAELEKNGLITKLEKQHVRHNEAWLKLVRLHLHLLTQRPEDRLMFDVQEQIAHILGYQASGAKRASEVLMKRYYSSAKEITHINHILLVSIAERELSTHELPSRLVDTHFLDRTGTLDIIDDDIYTKNPHHILRTFLIYAQEPNIKTLSARTFRALYNARTLMDASFRKDPVNAQTFMEILKAPQGTTHAFRLMNQTGVLGRYLWAFRGIVGQMQHDLFHVYTVDQHTLLVLRNIRRFFIPEHAHEYPLCSEIASEFDQPWLLYTAALFHDIAKGRQGDHSVLGAQEVVQFAKHHNISKEDSAFIEFLVAQHLSMSRIAQKEDIGDPEVINAFVKTVQDERHLNALFLLTVADIRATSPKVWNSWKANLLTQLYKITLHVLGGHVPEPAALVATRKRAALETLTQQGFTLGNEQALWSTLNISYFMRHQASDIAWHTLMLWDKVATPIPVVKAQMNQGHDSLQVLVYTPDRPDLFARICGFFSMTELSIVEARIHTTPPSKNTSGWALDTFELLPCLELQEEINPAQLEAMITHELQEVLQKEAPLLEPRATHRISRRARYFPLPPIIELHPDENQQRWLLSITAGDRVGLLYAVALVLAKHHINLELAKILTLGDRIEDTFLISGAQLSNPQFQAQLEHEIAQAIQL